jgi:hypothetical protein
VTNDEIQAQIRAAWEARKGLRVGDVIEMLDGTVRRFTYDWGTQIQTTMPRTADLGPERYYIGKTASADYSGALDYAIPYRCIVPTARTVEARFWHWKEGISGAGRGVDFTLPCRVYAQVAVDVQPRCWMDGWGCWYAKVRADIGEVAALEYAKTAIVTELRARGEDDEGYFASLSPVLDGRDAAWLIFREYAREVRDV